MAEKRIITAVIDNIDKRLADNNRKWGKYELYLEGHEDKFRVDVPPEQNAEFDLEEGMTITIQEGSYKSWICKSNSECFTGVPYPYDSETTRPAGNKRRKNAKSSVPQNGTATETAPAPAPKYATPKSGAPHTAWNQYQIDTRDPQMRMQTLLEISAKVHCTCIAEGCDPSEAMKAIIEDAINLDKEVTGYLGLD